MCIASLARWDTQLKGVVELDRRCQDLMQEVELLSERQAVCMVASKRDMQKEAPQKYRVKVSEEFEELEEQRAKEAYAHKVGRRKGKGENGAKIGRIEGDKASEWRSRQHVR